MIFYLKVNRENTYVIPNIKHWLDAIFSVDGNEVYLVCDNPDLKKEIDEKLISRYDRIEYISSIQDSEEIEDILDNVALGYWKKIGRAHLTTFYHAREKQYDEYWNIDADDTFLCLSPERLMEALVKVENKSKDKKIDLNNLDMWHSTSIYEKWGKVPHWSFGVTYVNGNIDWLHIMRKHEKDLQYVYMDKLHCNIDWYFTYLSQCEDAVIKTFCIENLKFMHYCNNFFDYPHKGSFYHFVNGRLIFPILKYCFETNVLGDIPIANDVEIYDIGIETAEAKIALINNCEEKQCFSMEIQEMKPNIDTIENKFEKYKEKYNCKNIVVYGAGDYFLKNYYKLRGKIKIDMLCDSSPKKWGKNIVDDLICSDPGRIMEMKSPRVIISVEQIPMSFDIVQRILSMGVQSIDHINNLMQFILGIE